ncbi:bifunctional phosphopantothenoylcysteine decarboxylase/phosphopantothenate--cysteine ligase CoaBC [Brachybacterium sp. EF45031]|uniref:bifunctional phosphopantothenoylcysteine decarboxylase/phosphopantothenate--cysteine ligase CoaBC n=1 Tax=Brachybacterium sillae TaxID=2810536 RepID=UPI00217EBF47|nr:bifunctional phosphopantothenoylcysteine decarboxylase/phosphopantothenate--cysteine ligase CoaBC [Brachybacterium sillae]MCS6710553.1 bifunctional phosphopantothenoylcysteine decarboxylase/phosphopantothenate--cysteine ligase CoaBC [Brachybacterium sillae]
MASDDLPCAAAGSARSHAERVRGLDGARVLVGVCGGIAAYKAAHLVRGLVASGAQVHVVPTPASLQFVGAATWEALSHHPVRTSVFEDVDQVAHVRLGQEADLVVVAPATADLLARVRMGRADDLLAAGLLVTRAPVIMAPAMHTEMWEHPATRENVEVLRRRGVHVMDPAVGRLTGADSGPGRLPEPESILDRVRAVAEAPRDAEGRVRQDLAGQRVLISAGGTREDLDPVRYLTNASSGKQGWALAEAALARGAQVTLLAATVDRETPSGARRRDVRSAEDLAAAVAEERGQHDVLIMAAAVADFTPTTRGAAKIKKDDSGGVPELPLRRTPDILAESVQARHDGAPSPRVIVGFAAETGDDAATALEHARQKARRKGADLLVVNDVSGDVFGSDRNAVHMLDATGEELSRAEGSKTAVAHAVLDAVVECAAEALDRRGGDVP